MNNNFPPWPHAARWSDAPLGSYCVAELDNVTFKVLKTSNGEGRCLATGRCIKFQDREAVVAILDFPQPHVCIHEAGHLVFALNLGEAIYVSEGIAFRPYSPDGGECGRWICRDAVSAIRLALIGVLVQVEMAPLSFEEGLFKVFQTSVILDRNQVRPADVSESHWATLGGSAQDFENARKAAFQASSDHSEGAIIELLRDQERYLKTLLKNTTFCEKVQLVVEDILHWLQDDGRARWEEAIVDPSDVFYPAARASKMLTKVGLSPLPKTTI